MIRRDIARTYPEHALFKQKDGVGQEALFNVMKAYSVHDREVGVGDDDYNDVDDDVDRDSDAVEVLMREGVFSDLYLPFMIIES